MFTHPVEGSVLASISLTQQIQRTYFDLEVEAYLNVVMNSLSVTDRKKEHIKRGYDDDTDMCALKYNVMSGWHREQTRQTVQSEYSHTGITHMK